MNKQKGGSLLIILVSVLVVAVVAAGAAYWYFVYSKQSPASTYTPSTRLVQTQPNFPPSQQNQNAAASPIQDSSEVDKLSGEVNSLQVDTGDNVSSADTVGL